MKFLKITASIILATIGVCAYFYLGHLFMEWKDSGALGLGLFVLCVFVAMVGALGAGIYEKLFKTKKEKHK